MSASKLRLYSRLQRASHALKKAADRELLRKAEMTTAQSALLAVISHERAVTQRGVASQLGLNESAVTAMVDRLSGLGLVRRKPDPTDGRRRVLTLTARGDRALASVAAPFGEINAKIDAALGPGRIDEFASCLDQLIEEFAAD